MKSPACQELLTVMQSRKKGLCATFVRDGERFFKGLPFMPGIFEYPFIGGGDSAHYRKRARLIHAYKKAYEPPGGQIEEIF